MFGPLHALAQKATLLIVITAEDATQLRVNVTPTAAAGKEHALRPLSLVATPEELDADFAAALAEWQAPRRSLIEQARDAVGDDDAQKAKPVTKALPAPAPKKAKDKPAAAKAATKQADKDEAATSATGDDDAAASTTAGDGDGDGESNTTNSTDSDAAVSSTTPDGGAATSPNSDETSTASTTDGAPPPPPAAAPAPTADVFTLDMF